MRIDLKKLEEDIKNEVDDELYYYPPEVREQITHDIVDKLINKNK